MNYKKSLISLVAAMALSTSALADGNAIYVPMSNSTNDGLWTLIGVNGLSTGKKSVYGSSTAGYSANFDPLVENNTTDYLETDGLGGLVSLLALQDSGLTALQIGMPVTGVTLEKKEPVRSMYVKVNSSTPNVKINYKASLEGVRVEFYINGKLDTRYESVISQDSTYADAVTATIFESSAGEGLSKIVDVLDFNSTDNPVEAKYFDKDVDLLTTGTTAVFYHYDAVSQQWKIWDNQLTGNANDFSEFRIGDAYWGFVDRNETILDSSSNAGGATTLVLGKSGNTVPTANSYRDDDTVADYNVDTNSRLTEGWNMIALDNIKPNIRHAATGLIITTKDVNATITLTDSTGAHSLDIPLVTNDTTGAKVGADQATAINLAFEKAKVAGDIPQYFNVKAFGGAATSPQDIILISDARFTIEDDRTNIIDFIGAVTTLTGEKPYNNFGGNVVAITDLDENGTDTIGPQESATSVYGEYALVLNTLVGATSVDTITGSQGFSNIEFGDASNGDHGAFGFTTGSSDIAGAVAGINSLAKVQEASFEPTATAIDTDNDGTVDMVIVADEKPFYVKDKTYTRVFEIDSTYDANVTVVGKTTETDLLIAKTEAPSAIAGRITAAGIDEVYGVENSADDKLIVVSVDKANFDLKDAESLTKDMLTISSSSEDLAKGAISSVHALDEIAKITLVPNVWTATGFTLDIDDINDTNDTICVEITSFLDPSTDGNGTLCTPIDPTDINGTGIGLLDGNVTNTTAIRTWFDAIVNDMNYQLEANVTNPLHGYAYHNYNESANNLETAEVVLVSYDANLTVTQVVADMKAPTTDFTNSTDALTLGGTGVIGGVLINDLTTNPIHTPDFASYGPLYTMYDAGYDVRAILKAETDLSSGSIIWDSIDLTRDEDDWFLNNEMNLFKSNLYSGYWVYLTQLTPPVITIGTPTYNSIYTYYFDKDGDATNQDTTTNIVNGGSLTVTVTVGDDTVNTTSVFASIAGVEFEMKRSGSSDDYTADLTNYAIAGFKQNDAGPIAVTIRVTNGKGEYKKDATFEYDFAAPTVNATTFPLVETVQLSTDNTNVMFHIFENYIPELVSTRADDDLTTLLTSKSTTAGTESINICKDLTFGETPEIVVITADGDGTIGKVNLSDAETFTYAVMHKGAQVLYHESDGLAGNDKSTVGTRYDTNCTSSGAGTDTGVSLKALIDSEEAYLSYEEISGINPALSSVYEQQWSIDGGTAVIQTQNLDEYGGKTFFVEYNSNIYTGTFATAGNEVDEQLTLIEPSNPLH